jgi:poly(A) polymerase
MLDPATGAVLKALGAGGAIVRFVGGCVRDAVLGQPTNDIDLATPEAPETVMALLNAAGIRAIPTGLSHGTVTAVIERWHFEITTLRRDVETDGRRAKVEFTDDWLEDAKRRDFTFNALYADADGAIYDPMGGLRDLADGRVRFVGLAAQRIEEDALRILRYFRFLARFGGTATDESGTDGAALAACREKRALLQKLSGERISGEILGLLAQVRPMPALHLMASNGILDEILGVGASLDRLQRVIDLEIKFQTIDPVRRLAALAPAGVDRTAAVAARWNLSGDIRERLLDMATPSEMIRDDMNDKVIRKALFRLGRDRFIDQVWMAHSELRKIDAAKILQRAELIERPVFSLRGSDVLALGVAAGPDVGAVLVEIETWWEDQDFSAGRELCLAELKRRVSQKNSRN